jgi:hypothetical protein
LGGNHVRPREEQAYFDIKVVDETNTNSLAFAIATLLERPIESIFRPGEG